MGPLDLLVIYGSVRHARQGIKAARFILGECVARGHRATLVDPLEEGLPLLDRMYKEYPPGQAPAALERLAARIKAADAFIIVSGEYNHRVRPALSNLLDHFLEEYFWRPSAIVCYSGGSFGGVRAAMQLRGDALRAGHTQHPLAAPRAPGAGRVRRRRPPAGRLLPRQGRPISRRAGVVRARAENRAAGGRSLPSVSVRLASRKRGSTRPTPN
jgi:NAD(P)H-dependent FMN reductase